MWTRAIDSFDVRTLSRWLLLAGWPLHIVFASTATAAGVLGVVTAQPALLLGTTLLAVHYSCGLCASFVLHELGHAIALRCSPGVTTLTLERTLWRISVSARGRIRGRDMFVAAAAGPGGCVAVGLLLLLACPDLLLHAWFLAHGLFLVPIFADGRAAIAGARSWHRWIGCERSTTGIPSTGETARSQS